MPDVGDGVEQAGLRDSVAPLGRHLLARHALLGGAGGQRLDFAVAERRRPKRLEAVRRLLPQRRSPSGPGLLGPVDDAPVPRPPGMSEFAARWLFGDGPPEGVPIDEAEALPTAPHAGEPPELPTRPPRVVAPSPPLRGLPPRGLIEEGRPLRLARKPLAGLGGETPDHPADDPIPLGPRGSDDENGKGRSAAAGQDPASTREEHGAPGARRVAAAGERFAAAPQSSDGSLSPGLHPARSESPSQQPAGPPVGEGEPTAAKPVPMRLISRVTTPSRPTVLLRRVARASDHGDIDAGGGLPTEPEKRAHVEATRQETASAPLRQRRPFSPPWRRLLRLFTADAKASVGEDEPPGASFLAPVASEADPERRAPSSPAPRPAHDRARVVLSRTPADHPAGRRLDSPSKLGADEVFSDAVPAPRPLVLRTATDDRPQASSDVSPSPDDPLETRGPAPPLAAPGSGGRREPGTPSGQGADRGRNAVTRPRLQLLSRAQADAPVRASRAADVPQSTTAAHRVASAAGAALEWEPGGRAAVTFPPPGAPTAAVSVARLESDAPLSPPAHSAEPGIAPPAVPAAPAAAPPVPQPLGSSAAAPPVPEPLGTSATAPPPPRPLGTSAGVASIDDLYDQVVERLRRDLLAERERMGDILGQLP